MKQIALAARRVEGLSGIVTIVLELAKRLTARGCRVQVFAHAVDEERARDAGAVPRRLMEWPWGSYAKRRSFAWNFERAAKGEHFDLIHGHGDTLVQDVLSLHNCVHAAHEAVHDSPLPASSGVGRLHERQLKEQRFKILIANSRLMAEDVARRFAVSRDKIRVIYPGHDPRRFNAEGRARERASQRAALNVGEKDILVGLITSGDFAKRGVPLFLEALGRLSPESRRCLRVLIAGKEERLAPYRALAREAGVAEQLSFWEPVPCVERFYHALDLYVHPAHFEEFGLSVQEAMACGVPVIASRRVGAAELMSGEAAEELLDRPDAPALAEKMERFLADENLRRRVGESGREAVKGNTWDKYFEETWAVYESLWK